MSERLENQLQLSSNTIIHNDSPEAQKIEIIRLFNELEGLDNDLLWDNQDHIEIPEGACIAPVEAAGCMLDTQRTVMFIRGLHAAIKKIKKKNQGQRVSVLYAGCGPFATLALPLTTQFNPDEVGFTLIDIHETSLTYVSKLISQLGLNSYFDNLICTDATQYEPSKKYDVIVTETMAKALFDEPQVAITENLKRHLSKNGIFVPEKISLGVKLESVNGYPKKQLKIGDFFELTKDSTSTAPDFNIEGTLPLDPRIQKHDIYSICLTTRVKVFGPHIINPGESLITLDTLRGNAFRQTEGAHLHIKYASGCYEEDIQMEVLNAAMEVLLFK